MESCKDKYLRNIVHIDQSTKVVAVTFCTYMCMKCSCAAQNPNYAAKSLLPLTCLTRRQGEGCSVATHYENITQFENKSKCVQVGPNSSQFDFFSKSVKSVHQHY